MDHVSSNQLFKPLGSLASLRQQCIEVVPRMYIWRDDEVLLQTVRHRRRVILTLRCSTQGEPLGSPSLFSELREWLAMAQA